MRLWTTRTLGAAVVAAGFAAVGAGGAAAAQGPDLAEPDLSRFPDDIGFTAPLNACRMQNAPGYHSTKAPCVDAQVRASAPNVVKRVGADVTTTAHGVAGELRSGRPVVSPQGATRLASHLGAEKQRLQELTKARPSIGVTAHPQHTGLIDHHAPGGGLLDTELGPRQPGHEGVSGGDTAFDLTAAQGYKVGPLARPAAAFAPVVRDNPNYEGGRALALPKVSEVVPAAKKATDMTRADQVTAIPEQVVNNAATGLRHPAR